MIIKELSIQESKNVYETFLRTHIVPENDLDYEYRNMRNDITCKYYELVSQGYMLYQLDYRFSLWFYQYMNSKNWFGERVASNYQFWNYVALKLMPDVIYQRWGDEKAEEHYFAKGLRVYPYTLYWYSHLSWQGSAESTEAILSTPQRFSTNSILHLVERPGRYYGTFINLYRQIMKQYAVISSDKYIDYKKLFESVMKLCMSRIPVMDPDLCPGGSKEYARKLVYDCI